jgi:hypothetical protein
MNGYRWSSLKKRVSDENEKVKGAQISFFLPKGTLLKIPSIQSFSKKGTSITPEKIPLLTSFQKKKDVKTVPGGIIVKNVLTYSDGGVKENAKSLDGVPLEKWSTSCNISKKWIGPGPDWDPEPNLESITPRPEGNPPNKCSPLCLAKVSHLFQGPVLLVGFLPSSFFPQCKVQRGDGGTVKSIEEEDSLFSLFFELLEKNFFEKGLLLGGLFDGNFFHKQDLLHLSPLSPTFPYLRKNFTIQLNSSIVQWENSFQIPFLFLQYRIRGVAPFFLRTLSQIREEGGSF